MRQPWKIAIALLAAVAGLCVVTAAATASRRPVLLSISPDPGMLRPRSYCVMNPFRDRSPERAAEQFLRQLRDGNLAVFTVNDPSSRERYVEREAKWPIQQWRIGRRQDDARRVQLMYWVKRGNGYSRDGDEEVVYLTVDRSEGNTRVTEFGAIY